MLAFPGREVEITLTAERDYANPYADVEVWAELGHDAGTTLRRPAFWDGGRAWKIRFASPIPDGRWTWRSFGSTADAGLAGQSGELACAAETKPGGRFERHGFWRMSPGGRNLVHADGTPALLVADTAWALPWRATEEQCRVYAADRQAKGFNAALLMSVQPDMQARGPRDRTAVFPGRGRRLARGAGFRRAALRRRNRAHPGRAADRGHGAELAGHARAARLAGAGQAVYRLRRRGRPARNDRWRAGAAPLPRGRPAHGCGAERGNAFLGQRVDPGRGRRAARVYLLWSIERTV